MSELVPMTTPVGAVPKVCGVPNAVLAHCVTLLTHGLVLWVTATVPVIVVEVKVTGTVFVTLTLRDEPVAVMPVVPAKIEALTPGTAAAAGAVPKLVTAVAPSAVPATCVRFCDHGAPPWLAVTVPLTVTVLVTKALTPNTLPVGAVPYAVTVPVNCVPA